ncbi:Fibronectin type III domain protein [Leptothrix cholodnii SP-6]|uniref:Fibronectin type III domain protein n=1 Tax=Leptothrix cholodnii (strain ATCC 51168 / LMG 8142 / SP-6) TaxID=395495 RepID=B1Y6M0_LEPCP|nr:fibronectin type III domain-containing protein [Leptothrix cholodnii]ACB36048.1 Fibronectin type III domain protein [Leptothrix cholodnii SP-6]
MRKSTRFIRTPIAAATSVLAVLLGTGLTAQAGVGFGESQDFSGNPVSNIRSHFAHSPRGDRESANPTAADEAARLFGAGKLMGASAVDTGRALRKFVDPLPLPGQPQTMADGTVRYLPVAAPTKWINPQTGQPTGDDYFEVAVIEYKQKLHSDLKNPTTIRGYVQLSTAAVPGKQVPLFYPDGVTPILVQETDARGFLVFNTDGSRKMVQARAVDDPHFLGPVIQARQGVPTRLKFINLLPFGRAELGAPDADGKPVVTARNGDIFLPLDKSIAGSGLGPDGFTEYTQNRANIHLHGGDTPWISDGTPHQWIAPAEEANAANGRGLAAQSIDPEFLPSFLRGPGAINVPDMPDPGPGAMTYYFPNGQSGRMLWYHDHSIGMTRLNVYAGMASAYLLGDAVQDALISGGSATVNGKSATFQAVLPPAADTIPLVMQDRTFVPADVALQDARWNTSAWGAESDSWFPHVYETVQDPNQLNGFNAVGRWHWGPWFWPVFPALYDLPSGEYGDVTVTPEAWMDTAMVNGVAYPTLDVDPKTYRFQILNASNDRSMSFNLFVADDAQPFTDPVTGDVRLTEVKMVDAVIPADLCSGDQTRAVQPDGSICTPATWPTDGRAGGVPSPASQGPTLYQIGSEGGLLPQVAVIDPVPVNYNYDRGRITVLNVQTPALLLGNAERADVVVDFSQYAGKTLIVYSDSPAPMPAGDPRNDYFTNVGDQSTEGGAENTKPGYGPNTRTFMRIKVRAAAPAPALDVAALKAEIPKAYALSQETPVVGQKEYNTAFGTSWTDSGAYADIYAGSLKQPLFKYTPGTPNGGGFNSVKVTQIGSGYVSAPTVTFADSTVGNEVGAKAQATLKMSAITVTDPGAGYVSAPIVSIVAQSGGGSGAVAEARLAIDKITITNGGAGYTSAPAVRFSVPPTGGVQASGTAIVTNGRVTGVTLDNPGSGYVGAPTVSFQGGGATTTARATATGKISDVKLLSLDPMNPIVYNADGSIASLGAAGGGGYTDMSQVLINFNGGVAPAGGRAAIASASGSLFDVTMVNHGVNYTANTTIAFSGGGGSGAAAQVDTLNGGTATGSNLVKTKAIHELFEPTFGRMNAILAVEIPFTSALTQTTIPLAMIDAPTERFADGETQIWKITHNGVDTHPVHFHLLNVQLINRVGWDGWIDPPAPNELGWKETIRMNPLEDVIVAVRAKRPPLPGFGVPNSIRPMDPSQPIGSPYGFTQIDPNTGTPLSVVNEVMNYGWEYVWHCHILGHEENDFMRPIVFDANEAVPTAPGALTASANGSGSGVLLGWSDTSATEYQFRVLRATGAAGTVFTPIGTALANGGSYLDNTAQPGTSYRYQVVAVGANGEAASGIADITTPTGAPVVPAAVQATQLSADSVRLQWLDQSTDEAGFAVEVSVNGGAFAALTTVGSSAANVTATGITVTFDNAGAAVGSTYTYRVAAVNASGAASAYVNSNTVTVMGPPAAPNTLTAIVNSKTQVALNWIDGSTDESQFVIEASVNGGAFAAVSTLATPSAGASGGAVTTNVAVVNGNTYVFRVAASNTWGSSTYATSASVPVMIAPNAPTAQTVSVAGAAVTLNWLDNATDETSFVVEGSLNGGAYATVATVTRTAAQATDSATPVSTSVTAAAGTWTYRVRAIGAGGASANSDWANSVTVTATGPAAPTTLTAVLQSSTRVRLSWVDASTNETSFLIQQSVNGGAFTQIGTVNRSAAQGAASGGVLSSQPTVAAGNTYVFRVIARNASGSSAPADVTITVAVAPAANLAVAAVSATSARLSWTDGGPLETGYRVERSTDGVNWTVLSTTAANATGYTATGLTTGTTYQFRVTAVRTSGGVTTTATPVEVSYTVVAPPVPTAPSALAVNATAQRSVTLGWVDNANNETSYRVEACLGTCTDASTWVLAATSTASATQQTGTGARTLTVSRISANGNNRLAAATTYSFRVVAVGASGNSGVSNIVTATTLP